MKKQLILFLALLSFTGKNLSGGEITVGLDYLYWHVMQSNMSYGLAVEDIATLLNPRVLNQEQNWASGFRLNADYSSCFQENVSFSWTRMHNTVSGSTDNPIIIATNLVGLGDAAIGGNGIGGPASSEWNLHFDIFDLNFGCFGFGTPLLQVSPFIGIRGGEINQNQFVLYQNFVMGGTVFTGSFDEHNNVWLLGPAVGFDGSYILGCDFSIFADFGVSFLYGKHRTKVITDTGIIAGVSEIRNIKNRIFPAFQTLIGIAWNKRFGNCCIDLEAGYEVQYFFHTWRIVNSTVQQIFITNTGFGDLMMHGLTLGLSVTF